jgi:hypothetical protein
MTRYLVCTTCNAEQWTSYGRAMASTFRRYWPKEVPLWLYTECFDPGGDLAIDRCIDLEDASDWLALFKAKYAEPQFSGRANGSYDFRRDAVRFAHKIAAIGAAARAADCDVLIWMDADTVTFAPVTVEWLNGLLSESAAVGWLDRVGCYPECGFLMWRLPAARRVIDELVAEYRSGAIFQLPQTHDSFVIQQVVGRAVKRGDMKVASLSGRGRQCVGHPWVNSPIGDCMDHLKGARKKRGHSERSDVIYKRSEPYWQAIQRGEKPAR